MAQVGFTCVGDETAPQFGQLGESTGTVWALVGALPCVQPQVSSEVALLGHSVDIGRVFPQCGASCGSAGSPGWPIAAHTPSMGMVKGYPAPGGSFGVATGKVGGQRLCHTAHTQRAGHLNEPPDAL